MKRPLLVTLSAVLLGLIAAFQLLAAVGMTVGAILLTHAPMPASTIASPLSPATMQLALFALVVVCLGLAVWSIMTLVGLLRLRSWARYSVLVIAGCMAALGAVGALASVALSFVPGPMTAAAPGDPRILRTGLLAAGAFYGLIAAVGVAPLVYFNLAKVRRIFLANAPLPLGPPNTATGRARPMAIAIVSWIMMVSAPLCLIYMFLPVPAFFFGVILRGIAAHLLYVVFGVLCFTVGYGLYRLTPWARAAMAAWIGLGCLNFAVMLTPWGQRGFAAYMADFTPHITPQGTLAPSFNLYNSMGMIVVSCVFGFGINLFLLWLLQRHRIAFTPAPSPPPRLDPLFATPDAL